VLGTVGTKSPLFNCRKSFEAVVSIVGGSEADDTLVEALQESAQDVLEGISNVSPVLPLPSPYTPE